MAKLRFHDLTISTVRADTASSVELSFEIPAALASEFVFKPGQYLTLRAMVDGQDLRRSYSICSALGAPQISVGIKRIEGGAFSSFALSLKPGDVLQVMPPQGRFTAPIGGRHNYLLLAAGSGVTPIKSIAQSVLGGEADSTVTLCYANRNTESIMFRQAFDDLKDRYLTRFLMTHVMDEEAQDVALFNGRMDAEKLSTMATRGLISPMDYDAIYICGPQPMITAASEALTVLGVPLERINLSSSPRPAPCRLPARLKRPPPPAARGLRWCWMARGVGSLWRRAICCLTRRASLGLSCRILAPMACARPAGAS